MATKPKKIKHEPPIDDVTPPLVSNPREMEVVRPTPIDTMRAKSLRDAVEDVFYEMGGVQGLVEWAQDSTVNKRLFYTAILPKVIPKEVNTTIGDGKGGAARMVVEWASPDAPTESQQTDAIANLAANVTMVTNMLAAEDD